MGEISFNYNVKSEPVQEASFKYWFSESIEYSFAYQRYIAFSDASIFNSPVAITKVATGLYQYYDLFLDKKAHAVTHNTIKNFDVIWQNIQDNADETLSKSREGFSEFESIYGIIKSLASYINVHKDNTLYMHDLIGNEYNFLSLIGNRKSMVIHSKEYWLLKDFLLNIYSDSSMAKNLYHNKLNVYNQLYNLYSVSYMDIKNTGVLTTPFDSTLNIYETFLTVPSRVSVDILVTGISSKTPDNILNTQKNILSRIPRAGINVRTIFFGKTPDKKLNKLENVLLKFPHPEINVYDVLFGRRNDLIANIIPQVLLTKNPEVYNGHINDTVNANYIKKDMVYNKTVLGKVSSKYIIRNDFTQGYIYGRTYNVFDNIMLPKINVIYNLFSEINEATRPQPKSFFDKQYSIHFYTNPLCHFNIDTFTISEQKYCFTINNMAIAKDFGHLQSQDNIYQCLSEKQQILKDKKHVFGNKHEYNLQSDTKQEFVVKYYNLLDYTNKSIFIETNYKDIHNYYTQYFIDKDKGDFEHFSHIFIGKFSKSFELYEQIHVYRDRISMEIYKSLTADKIRKGFSIDKDKLFALRDNLSTDIEMLNIISVDKDKININPGYNILDITRNSYSIYTFSDLWTAKENYNVYLHADVDSWIFKDEPTNHDMSLFSQYFASKNSYYTTIYQQMHTFVRNKIIVSTLDFDTVIKNHLPTNYINILNNNYTGMIIPISKVRHQGYIDNINLMISKLSKSGYLHQSDTASVIPKDARFELVGLFCDKKEFDTYINYKNIQITKSKIHAFINNRNIFIDKSAHDCDYNKTKDLIWIDKNPVDIWANKQVYIQKHGINVNVLNRALGISTVPESYAYTHNPLFVDKNSQICYYDYGMTWADKELEAKINAQLHAVGKLQEETHMFDCVSPSIRNELNGFYDYGVFTDRVIHESDLFKQIHNVHKKAYDSGIKPEDFGNWAWVYETPDPFDGLSFTIDELLLPENDTRYEDFEDIIFDKKNMRPKNPVKVINDNTFIAKYPTKHPLPKYSEVAIEYDKSAIKFENFYGIETGIIQTVFLKFYRIWQSKIFEFGTMTMVQSVKLMLEYMYSWIMEYFPVEEIEQALRVFKLIRWYGETSIIQNSQYIITYEYGTLESKLNTGECLIPNDLDTNDTMYVDARLSVIRNNPTYINTNTGAYVTFEVNNKKNTTFTFSLSNTVGSVNIYINDVLVDTVSRSALNLTYELPCTGEPNIIKIEKTASHNLNGNFYIGNIKVPNTTFKELSIEFDPTLKAGNKPLNEIARKMISFANLYDNKEEAYEIIKKGNLGVGETYKHLMEYWELHHKDKVKGKRLTIKEV